MVDDFLRKAKDSIFGPTDEEQRDQSGFDPSQARPASEDPYGDPAYQEQFGDVRPASEDPYGDPAYQEQFGDVRPASEDPYGDPADQQNTW